MVCDHHRGKYAVPAAAPGCESLAEVVDRDVQWLTVGPRSAEDLPAPAASGISPEAVRSFRSQLTTGEDVVDPHDVGRVDSPGAGHRAPGADRQEPVVQPAVVAADRIRRS